jgi:hypothetical protein
MNQANNTRQQREHQIIMMFPERKHSVKNNAISFALWLINFNPKFPNLQIFK